MGTHSERSRFMCQSSDLSSSFRRRERRRERDREEGDGEGGRQKKREIYIYINIKKRKGRPRWREASNARGERLVKYLRSSSKGKTVKLSSLSFRSTLFSSCVFPPSFIGIFSFSLSPLCFSD